MLRQPLDKTYIAEGLCGDCGMMVPERLECIDGVTHSRVALCERCWHVFRQRQMFGGGCCG